MKNRISIQLRMPGLSIDERQNCSRIPSQKILPVFFKKWIIDFESGNITVIFFIRCDKGEIIVQAGSGNNGIREFNFGFPTELYGNISNFLS